MKQRLFPRVRPNDPFTFNTSVALTTTNTKEAKAAYFFIKKKITYTKSENYGQQHQTIDGCQIGVSFERNVIANAFKNRLYLLFRANGDPRLTQRGYGRGTATEFKVWIWKRLST